MTWLLYAGVIYLTGVALMAGFIMPWVQRSIRAKAKEWGVDQQQTAMMLNMSIGDFWWVALVWPMLAVMWLLLKVSGPFRRG